MITTHIMETDLDKTKMDNMLKQYDETKIISVNVVPDVHISSFGTPHGSSISGRTYYKIIVITKE